MSDLETVNDILLRRLRLPTHPGVGDPLVIALEAAVSVANRGQANYTCVGIMNAVTDAMPPNATLFERGLCLGMAMMLATEQP